MVGGLGARPRVRSSDGGADADVRSPVRFGSRVRVGLAAVAVAAGLLGLTGCGVSAASLHPSAAAQVGDTTISLQRVDDATRAYCTLSRTQPISGAAARQQILEGFVLRAVADQVDRSGDYGVSPSSRYQSAVQSTQAPLKQLSSAQRATLEPAVLGASYFVDLMTQIGEAESGLTPAQDTSGAGLTAGIRLAQDYLRDHPVTVDPAFQPIDVSASGIVSEPDDGSAAVSSFARAAADEVAEATPTGAATAYVDSLPASQRCG